MQYKKELLDSLIKQGFETDHVDFKAGFNWHSFNERRKVKVVKHIAAMSNISGGGILIFGITDKREVQGLSREDVASFDRTRFDQTLKQFLDPIPQYQMTEVSYQKKQLLILEVEEFSDIPIICTTDYLPILRAGGVYVRQNASSTIIQDARAMRELIELATKKKKHDILESIEQILEPEQDSWKL